MNYKHIIFDIDGTLLDSMYADLHGLQDTMWELTHQIFPSTNSLLLWAFPEKWH